MRLPTMNSLKAFEVAARLCSFKRASEELCVTPGAVSRFVKLLENELGVELFERLPNGVRLTETGKSLYPKLSRSFREIESATIQASSTRNEIRVIIPPTIGARLLIGKIAEYNEAKFGSKVQYSVEFQNWNNYVHGDYDMGVCCHNAQVDGPDGIEYRFIRSESLTPVCSPKMVTGNPPLKYIEDLSYFDLLHSGPDKADWKKWTAATGAKTIDPERGQTFMSSDLAVGAAVKGYGVTVGDLTLLDGEMQRGELVAPFDFVMSENTGYFIFGNPERLNEPHISKFCDWLIQEIA